jgi:predicted nucleotidyltransferase
MIADSSRVRSNSYEANISLRTIRRYATQVAERFRPNQIVLFGSYAYGKPTAESDVDLLVVMPARNQLDMAAQIRLALRAPFPMDLIVRTPKRMRERLAIGDSFTTEIVSKGKVLYEEVDRGFLACAGASPQTPSAFR